MELSKSSVQFIMSAANRFLSLRNSFNPITTCFLSSNQLKQRFPSNQRYFSSSSGSKVIILAEHNNSTLNDSTASAITAALKINPNSDIKVLVIGENIKSVAESAAQLKGVTSVLTVQGTEYKNFLAEPISSVILDYSKSAGFDYLIAPSTSNGKNILPRVAINLDVQPITDITEIASENSFIRPIYAGNALETVTTADKIKVLTIRPTNFAKTSQASSAAAIEAYKPTTKIDNSQSQWISEEISKSVRPELGSAKIVVSGGRGLKSGENFKILEALADKLGAGLGASRAAVDAGFVPNELQVGQTGKVVAPQLYIAVGISGAIQHLAGMKDSKTIVAINKDPEAPIFQVADYGLVGDLFKIVPELTQKL
jgi:electron transfer flavoprotein alpha subunit